MRKIIGLSCRKCESSFKSSHYHFRYLSLDHHAICITPRLKGHIFSMKHCDLFTIVEHDIPGPNEGHEKTDKLRTFVIPKYLIEPGSSSEHPWRIKIFVIFLSRDWVYVLINFLGLARMHFVSKDLSWTSQNLAVGSYVNLWWYCEIEMFVITLVQYWDHLSRVDQTGPWNIPSQWCLAILEEHKQWMLQVKTLRKAYNNSYN